MQVNIGGETMMSDDQDTKWRRQQLREKLQALEAAARQSATVPAQAPEPDPVDAALDKVVQDVGAHPLWPRWVSSAPAVREQYGNSFDTFIEIHQYFPHMVARFEQHAVKAASKKIQQGMDTAKREVEKKNRDSVRDDPRFEQAMQWAANRPAYKKFVEKWK